MKRANFLVIVSCITVLLFWAVPARGQLIVSDKLLKVVKADPDKMRIEVTGTEDKPDNTTGYVYVDGRTTIHRDGKPFDWKKMKKGWIIRVKGGVRFDMNVNAVNIWVIKTVPGS